MNTEFQVSPKVIAPLALMVTAALSVAQFSSCFKEIEVDLACNLGECDTSANCDLAPPNTIVNEMVTLTQSPGNRKETTSFGFLCFKVFTIRDENGHCNIPGFCETVIGGAKANGGMCQQSID